MTPFTFYIYDSISTIPNFEFVWCADGRDATEHARLLLNRFAEAYRVEVFDGGSWRVSVDRVANQAEAEDPKVAVCA
jgi:hypothetical protein